MLVRDSVRLQTKLFNVFLSKAAEWIKLNE